jgi:uncharacterized protein YpmB
MDNLTSIAIIGGTVLVVSLVFIFSRKNTKPKQEDKTETEQPNTKSYNKVPEKTTQKADLVNTED